MQNKAAQLAVMLLIKCRLHTWSQTDAVAPQQQPAATLDTCPEMQQDPEGLPCIPPPFLAREPDCAAWLDSDPLLECSPLLALHGQQPVNQQGFFQLKLMLLAIGTTLNTPDPAGKKAMWVPQQQARFLGMFLDAQLQRFVLPKEKQEDIRQTADVLLQSTTACLQQAAGLACRQDSSGSSCSPFVPFMGKGHLHKP